VRTKSDEDARRVAVKVTRQSSLLPNTSAGQFRAYISDLFRLLLQLSAQA
jgi:hypothetical protein